MAKKTPDRELTDGAHARSHGRRRTNGARHDMNLLSVKVVDKTQEAQDIVSRNWPQAQVHVEYFSGAAQDDAGNTAFDVKIASTGESFLIEPGCTITDVLAGHGIFIPVSCEEGICGTCLTGLLGGRPDHRDLYLTEEEHAKNDQFTPCCSRAQSATLVLDL